MNFFIGTIFSLLCLSSPLGYCIEPSEEKLKTLYNSLNPTSISQHLAFHELYPRTRLGKQALRDAWQLLSGVPANQRSETLSDIPLTLEALDAIVSMVNKPPDLEIPLLLNEEAKRTMVDLSARLHHSKLKGHQSWDEREVQNLPLEEIDLARGLFLSQFGADISRILTYESYIDLMALAILARLPENASPEEKITSINAFIFDEMGFRFPPHSLYAKEIDLYTFLASVLDSRRGVCLGVSFLYLCLAQRLGLPLEMITPPGHIYVRYRLKKKSSTSKRRQEASILIRKNT